MSMDERTPLRTNAIYSKENWRGRKIWLTVGMLGCIGASLLFFYVLPIKDSGHKKQPMDNQTQKKSNKYNLCDDPDYTDITLKTVHEQTIIGLLGNTKGQKKFEASDMQLVGNDFYVVFDNLEAIGKFDDQLAYNSPNHYLVGDVGTDSGFEGIVYDPEAGTFIIMVEAIQFKEEHFHGVIKEVKIDHAHKRYTEVSSCLANHTFDSGNKGFEGIEVIRKGESRYMLGLCEGNFCGSGELGETPGNGKIVVMKKEKGIPEVNGYTCRWQPVRVWDIPSVANFVDYSAISIMDGRVAISSQQSSQLWISTIDLSSDDPNEWEFADGRVYNFPRNDDCEVIYCNIEGIQWLDNNMLAAVSDKMKRHGRQDFRCLTKDQSLHLFDMP